MGEGQWAQGKKGEGEQTYVDPKRFLMYKKSCFDSREYTGISLN
jgi:hypothetical protein